MASEHIAALLTLLLVVTLSCGEQSERTGKPETTPEALLMAPTGEREPGIDEFIPVDQLPVPLSIVEPEYPQGALAQRIRGRVFVKVLVGERGQVERAVVLKSMGNAELEKAAVAAALRWIFKPAQNKGRPVRVWIAIPFVFKLK